MFKLLLISIVFAPVLIGALAGRTRDGRRGLLFLLAFVLTYNVLFVMMLYYLRVRWSAG